MKDDGAIFPDGTHELFVYKVSVNRRVVYLTKNVLVYKLQQSNILYFFHVFFVPVVIRL